MSGMLAGESLCIPSSLWCWIPYLIGAIRLVHGKCSIVTERIALSHYTPTSFQFAVRHFTYRLPPLNRPKEVFAVYRKMTRPLSMFLSIALGLHAIAAMAMTQKEILDFHRLEQDAIKEELLS